MRFIIILLFMSWITTSAIAQDIPITSETIGDLQLLYAIPAPPKATYNSRWQLLWSESSNRLLTHEDSEIEVYDVTTGDILWTYESDQNILNIDTDEDMHHVMIHSFDRETAAVHIDIWNIETNTLRGSIDDVYEKPRIAGVYTQWISELNQMYTWIFEPPMDPGDVKPNQARLKVWDLDGKLLNEVDLPTALTHLSLSPDHTRILARGLNHDVVPPSILTTNGDLITTLSHETVREYLAIDALWSADGSRILSYVGNSFEGQAIIGTTREAHIWTADGDHLVDLTAHEDWYGKLSYKDDLTRFLLTDYYGAFAPRLVDENGEIITEFTEMIRDNIPASSYLSPDAQYVFFTNKVDETDPTLPRLLYYRADGELLDSSMTPGIFPSSISRDSILMLNSTQVCTNDDERQMKLWNPEVSLEEPLFSYSYEGWMRRRFFLPNSELIIGVLAPKQGVECPVESENRVIIWDTMGTELFSAEINVAAMYVSEDETQLFISTPDAFEVWGIPSD